MNLYGEGTHRFTCSSVLYSTVHLFWCWATGYNERITGWMAQSSECGIKALALHIALRYVLTLNIGNIFLQIRNNYFPSLIKFIIGILMKRFFFTLSCWIWVFLVFHHISAQSSVRSEKVMYHLFSQQCSHRHTDGFLFVSYSLVSDLLWTKLKN